MNAVINRQIVLVAIIVALALVGVMLVWVLIGSMIIQRRRYLRTREHLGGRLLAAQDEERAAIARELHDDTVQRLMAIASQLRTDDFFSPEGAAAQIDRLIDDLRGLARGIHPILVDHLGLDAALRELAVSFGEREDIAVEYSGLTSASDLGHGERLALYRVAQEALGNAARHAQVTEVRMRLSVDADAYHLVIEDSGVGFDARDVNGPGIGITSMQERLSILGGSISVDGVPAKGTRVTAILRRERRQS